MLAKNFNHLTSIITLLAQLITAVPVEPTLNETNAGVANCIPSAHFTRSGWLPEDCYAAVSQLFFQQITRGNPDTSQEFYPFNRPPTSPRANLKVSTPKKWTVNTCNIAVVMLEEVMRKIWRSDLPGIRGTGWPYADFTTFRDVMAAAKSMEHTCAEKRTAGWVQIGNKDGIGVFVWATGSYMDESFPDMNVGGLDDSSKVVSMSVE